MSAGVTTVCGSAFSYCNPPDAFRNTAVPHIRLVSFFGPSHSLALPLARSARSTSAR